MSELRTIRLYGHMGARFGRTHRLAVASPAEAVRALCAMVGGFERYLMTAKDNGFGFAVLAGKRQVAELELCNPVVEDIRIAPITLGAKSGVFQLILGATLVVIGVFTSQAWLVQLGISLAIGGVVQLLTPHPKGSSSKNKTEPNYFFNGIVNTEAQGNPVPVVYGGPIKVGSAVISAGIIANDGVYVPTSSASLGSGNSFGSVIYGLLAGSMGSGGGAGGTPTNVVPV